MRMKNTAILPIEIPAIWPLQSFLDPEIIAGLLRDPGKVLSASLGADGGAADGTQQSAVDVGVAITSRVVETAVVSTEGAAVVREGEGRSLMLHLPPSHHPF